MRTKQDLEQSLSDLKRETEPLMSREDVQTLLAAHPITSQSSTTTTRDSRVLTARHARKPWIIGGSLAVATTVALIAVNTWDTENTSPELAVATYQVERHISDADVSTEESVVSQPVPKASGSDGMPSAQDGSDAHQEMQQSTNAVETVRLGAEQLASLGIRYERGSIVYVEDGVRVTIRATGVATKTSIEVSDQASITPTMVVVYHDKQHFASWWDKTDSKRDGLIAITVPLDVNGTMAAKAEVVLWFNGSKDFAERLPEPFRRQVLRELGIVQGSTPTHYIEPVLGNSTLVAASSVFPNPLRSGRATVRLQLKRQAASTGIITDMFGRQIAVAWQSQTLDVGPTDLPLVGLDNAPTGVYNVVITFDGSTERIVQRLMIQR